MRSRLTPLKRMAGEQERASSPASHAALSASAGTGKTHVLTARVLRLLLSGADPASILCLTFTKAGAAEMAQRIHERLAYWVRLKDAELRKELFALGEPNDDGDLWKARTLFARVLDAAGGGLRIQTIHAFAQGLLAAFPAEAGLVPGFRPLEGREEQRLARETLAAMLVRAEAEGQEGLIRDVQALSHRLGEGGAEGFLKACARAPDAMAALGPAALIEDKLRLAFGLPQGDIDEALAAECCDDLFDLDSLRKVVAANRAWGTPTGLSCCDLAAAWLGTGNSERAGSLEALAGLVLTKSGDPKKPPAGLLKADPDYAEHAARLVECCTRLLSMKRVAALVACLACGLRAGQLFAEAYASAKRSAGAVDFDDLIRWTEQLLSTPGMGDWVRYKLDQATDHILVDEAQDTNAAQWEIVRSLAEEYFAGAGAAGRHRTLFTVGDYKQAIFGFQGTDPAAFDQARDYFEAKARAARSAADELELPERELPPEFLDLSMDRSFRSSPPILRAVDAVITGLGHEALGLPRAPNVHVAEHDRRSGSVALWQAFSDEAADDGEAGEEGWVSDTVRGYATAVAKQVRAWLANPFMVEAKKRPLRPEDILILVRRRGDLAALLVARLHAEGVPVAGVDRLLLTAPLAVRDLLAAARFSVQPLDDLNLASLLVSPLFGWPQERLYEAAFGRDGPLWPRVRDAGGAAANGLQSLLAMADYATPHQFLETILSGALDGRRKLVARLGPEARDPIEELLSAALEFETSSAPSLQRFLDWFARGEVEIVRDPSAPLDAVRVMTVHGSKGLQSPVVILADACADPDRSKSVSRTASLQLGRDGPKVPIFRPRKDELTEPLKSQVEAQDRLDREEHWRLLYVAMTRAEERLYLGGAVGAADRNRPPREAGIRPSSRRTAGAGAPGRWGLLLGGLPPAPPPGGVAPPPPGGPPPPPDRNGPSERSWYSAVERALGGLGGAWADDPEWGRALRFGEGELLVKAASRRAAPVIAPPAWLRQPAPLEERPPRPLAPSALGEDDVSDPPPSGALREAAERGRLLHQLFERLPDVPADERRARAERWLEHSAGVEDAVLRRRLIEDACRIIDEPDHAELFGPEALAEAPIAAVIGDGIVVSGTVDRLLVEEKRVLVADFKTGRKPPQRLEDIPAAHLRQMAAYSAALAVIFPARAIEAKLLYTAGPILFDLPRALLERFVSAPSEVETGVAAH